MLTSSLRGRAFTLIELLVVIAILSLLSSILLVSLNEARVKARNSKRVQDLIQVRNALELYRAQFGQYPVPCNRPLPSPAPDCNTKGISCWDCVGTVYEGYTTGAEIRDSERLSEIAPYLTPRPEDPRLDPTSPDSSKGYWYQADSNGNNYKVILTETVEGGSGNIIDGDYRYAGGIPTILQDPNYMPQALNIPSLSISSTGGKCWTWDVNVNTAFCP